MQAAGIPEGALAREGGPKSSGPLPAAHKPNVKPEHRSVHDFVKDVHTYLGLFNFSHLIIFGIAGLVATFLPPSQHAPQIQSVEQLAFEIPAGQTDKQIADAVHARLNLPLTGPLPEYAIRRNPEGPLLLNFYTVNGPHRVTVLEEEGQLHVETLRNNAWRYVSNLHATLRVHDHSGDWRMAAWTWYVEIALWSFLGMAFSGIFLWVSSRPRYRTALLLLLGGGALFIIMYIITR